MKAEVYRVSNSMDKSWNFWILYFKIDQNKGYIFVVDKFFLTLNATEIWWFEDRHLKSPESERRRETRMLEIDGRYQLLKILYISIDQVKSYIFVVNNFLIALHAFEICAFKTRDLPKRRRQSDTLASLRLPRFYHPIFRAVYLKSVMSYQKVVNCKNVALELFYKLS